MRVKVSDQHEHRTARKHRSGVQRAYLLGSHLGHVLSLRNLAGGRVVAVPVLLQCFARDGARLRPRDRDALDQPLPLARDLCVAVRRAGEHVAEHVQQRRQAVGQRGAAEVQPLRVHARVEVAADQRDLGVDFHPVAPRGAGEHGFREHFRGGRVHPVLARERDPQPQFDHRDARLAHREHAQPVGQRGVHMGQIRGGALVPQCGQRTRSGDGAADLLGAAVCGFDLFSRGHCSVPSVLAGFTTSTARASGRSAFAAADTASPETADSRSASW